MVFLHIVSHPSELIHVFALPTTVVSGTKQMFVWWAIGLGIFYIVILPAIVDAVCQLLVGLIQIIRDIEMRTASAAIQNKVKIVGNDDKKNSVEFLEPSKLTHKLEKKRKEINNNWEGYCGTKGTTLVPGKYAHSFVRSQWLDEGYTNQH
jgi:hypothetical protein